MIALQPLSFSNRVNCPNILLTTALVISLLNVAKILAYASYGLDISDESFYLLSIKNPEQWANNIPISFFGYVYSPIFNLLEQDLTKLRIFNITLTLILALFFIFNVYIKIKPRIRDDPYQTLTIIVSFSTLSLISIGPWLLTPNYNSLALQSILIALTGILLAIEKTPLKHGAGMALLGIGGSLLFLAKPSSAAALALTSICLIPFLTNKRDYLKIVAVSGISSLLIIVIFSYVSDTSFEQFYNRIINSISLLKILGSGQEIEKIFRIDTFQLSIENHYLAATSSFLTVIISYAFLKLSKSRHPKTTITLLTTSIILSYYFVIRQTTPITSIHDNLVFFLYFLYTSIFIVIIKAILFGEKATKRQLLLTILLLITPYIYAFGTNGNYWHQGAYVVFFWGISTIVFTQSSQKTYIKTYLPLTILLLCQLFLFSYINFALSHPYRQPPNLISNNKKIEIPKTGQIHVSKNFYDYFTQVLKYRDQYSFKEGTPIIDLTGQSPGVILLMGGRSLGQPWLVGGYPGSTSFAIRALRQEPCDQLLKAWILIEPQGERRLNEAVVLDTFGRTLSHYNVAASFKASEYAGGTPYTRYQYLLKPQKPSAEGAIICENIRKTDTL